MNEKTFNKLEFNKIIDMLAKKCDTESGAHLCANLLPHRDCNAVIQRLKETDEARSILLNYDDISLAGVKDIKNSIDLVRKNGILDGIRLREILSTCKAGKNFKLSVSNIKSNDYPVIRNIAQNIVFVNSLERIIEESIGEGGEILDSASPALQDIRRKKHSIHNRIQDTLDRIVKSDTGNYLRDSIITVRNDRYVVPVRTEYRNQVQGIVHDQSASGQTLFIEPMAVLELNNDLKKLAAEEETEMQRILHMLSSKVYDMADSLITNLKLFAEADFILAKGRLSLSMDAYSPAIKEKGPLKLVQARHPLIGKNAVPVDIELGSEYNGLIITGPNTGGKTVTLKIIGLFVLMTQSGLHIPAGETSEMPVFRGVYADIGDEQSIEQSLSTFSSHMVNIIDIMEIAGENKLVLLDELGAGTDPVEGAALAMSIIETLLKKRSKIVVTTHYSELKAYAYNHNNLMNAGMEFDIDSLRPTYRLLMGIPGRSNAFDIALSLGIDKDVVIRADSFMNEEQKEIHDFLDNLERGREGTEKAKREAEELKQQMLKKEEELKEREKLLAAKEEASIANAEERAARIVREKRLAAEEALKEIKEVLSEVSAKQRGEILNKVKKKKAKIDKLTAPEVTVHNDGDVLKSVSKGDEVFIPKLNQNGYVIEPEKNGEVLVRAGIMKITLKLDELRAVKSKSAVDNYTVKTYIREAKSRTVSNEISLRGLTADEAIEELRKYIDDAALANLEQIKIIHGLGTGVLRTAVSEYLKKDSRIKEQRPGGYYEGGAGVTIAFLK